MDWQRMVDLRAVKGKSLEERLLCDAANSKRGSHSLPKLRFMEGPGPEDPKYDPSPRAA
jgi:hypothetical protein